MSSACCAPERLWARRGARGKGTKDVCANVDLFSGLIYRMLGISEDLFTPLFAISRIPGWCAHRVEEVVFANRIMRPAYKYLGHEQEYIPLEERMKKSVLHRHAGREPAAGGRARQTCF